MTQDALLNFELFRADPSTPVVWASATNVYHIKNGLEVIWKDEAIASTFSAFRKWEIIWE